MFLAVPLPGGITQRITDSIMSKMTRLYFAIDDALVVLTIVSGKIHPGRPAEQGCVTVDPLRPELIYCGTFGSGLWRSDNGKAWSHGSVKRWMGKTCLRRNFGAPMPAPLARP
jgi:hypothetical protein